LIFSLISLILFWIISHAVSLMINQVFFVLQIPQTMQPSYRLIVVISDIAQFVSMGNLPVYR